VDYLPILSQHFRAVGRIGNKFIDISRNFGIEQKGSDTAIIKVQCDPTADMMMVNGAMILSYGVAENESLGASREFTKKLMEVLQCRWGEDIESNEDVQLYNFKLRGVDVTIVLPPDSMYGVHV
jgi:hypothetical protein